MLQATDTPFVQRASGGAVLRLSLVNFLLNLITLSFWRFWGHTRVRRLLWSHTTLWGEPLEYAGTGKELFLGFLAVVFVVLLPLMLAFAVLQELVLTGNMLAALGIALLQFFTLFLAGSGLYRARRYRLTRTTWRGIRCGLDGQAWRYGLMVAFGLIAAGLSLGWSWPATENWLERYKLANTKFGDHRFACEAKAGPLYRAFFHAWLLAVLILAVSATAIFPLIGVLTQQGDTPTPLAVLAPLLGFLLLGAAIAIPFLRYRVAFWRNLAAGTRFADASFTFDTKAWTVFRLGFGNWLLTVLSLGVLKPMAALRTFRFVATYLQVSGTPDFAAIAQGTAAEGRTGEGLAAVFDGAGAL